MEDGIKLRIKGKLSEIKSFINYLEKENVVIKRSDFIDDDKELGSNLIFVTALPKKVVTETEQQ
jgi:hypothetical protein